MYIQFHPNFKQLGLISKSYRQKNGQSLYFVGSTIATKYNSEMDYPYVIFNQMPPKYLNRQRPQQIGLDLVPVPSSSSSNRNASVPRNETKPKSLRTDVQSYLANLEKTLQSKLNLNDDSNERAKTPVVTEKAQNGKKTFVDDDAQNYRKIFVVVNKLNVQNERQNEVLHWSDLSISSESPDSSETKQKIVKNVPSKHKDSQKHASDYSISSK